MTTETATAFPKLLTLADTTTAERRPMTHQESEMYLRMSIADRSAEINTLDGIRDMVATFGMPAVLAIMLGRLECANPSLRYSGPLLLFLASLCTLPGQAVMWAHWLVHATYDKPEGSAVSCADFANVFPIGIPTDVGQTRIWDAQKAFRHGLRGDNLVDQTAAWRRTP